eukprot:6214242-Pleurochrysis_carterae.AAC.2
MWALAGAALRAKLLASRQLLSDQGNTASRAQVSPAATPTATSRASVGAAALSGIQFSWAPKNAASLNFAHQRAHAPVEKASHAEAEEQSVQLSEEGGSDSEKEKAFESAPDDDDYQDGANSDFGDDAEPTDDGGSSSGFYGAAGYSSSIRVQDEQDERARAAKARKKRPSHDVYRREQLKPERIASLITSPHRCRHEWADADGELVPCNHFLWAKATPDAVKELTSRRQKFLKLNRTERARKVFEAISFVPVSSPNRETPSWQSPCQPVEYRVGLHLTASRLTALKRTNSSFNDARARAKVAPQLSSTKSLLAISWLIAYAKQTSEKLPDVAIQLTPHRYLRDIYESSLEKRRHATAVSRFMNTE